MRDAALISVTASLMRLIGTSERHPNASALKRDRNVQLCALAAGIGLHSPKLATGAFTEHYPGPLGCQLTKLFGSRLARRNFAISLARWLPTSATSLRQVGVSASMAIWSSVSLSSSASQYGVLRSLLGPSQAGSELMEGPSSMSCPVPLPQSHVACWRRSVLLSNSPYWPWFFLRRDHVVNDRSV